MCSGYGTRLLELLRQGRGLDGDSSGCVVMLSGPSFLHRKETWLPGAKGGLLKC